MPDVVVTLKLSGGDYRLLCRELDAHHDTLKGLWEALPANLDKRAAQTRLAAFDRVKALLSE